MRPRERRGSGEQDLFRARLVGNEIERVHVDAGYRGHNAPPDYRFKVYTSKQKRRLTPQIEREMRRRSAIEP